MVGNGPLRRPTKRTLLSLWFHSVSSARSLATLARIVADPSLNPAVNGYNGYRPALP
jgi:hypothetical protein